MIALSRFSPLLALGLLGLAGCLAGDRSAPAKGGVGGAKSLVPVPLPAPAGSGGAADPLKERREALRKMVADLKVADPVSHGKLTVYPVIDEAADPKAAQEFATLKEALENKWVQIAEKGEGGNVPVLRLVSDSPRDVYVPAGSVLLGGKQDRVVRHDFVVAKGKQEMDVNVFCVEHGRWNATDLAGKSGNSFHSTQGNASYSVLKSLKSGEGSQQEVWNKVAAQNHENASAPSTGSFRAVKEEGKTAKELPGYKASLGKVAENHPRMVGLVFVVDGKLNMIDCYNHPAILRQQFDQLLESASIDAITGQQEKEAPEVKDQTAAARLLGEVFAGELKKGTAVRNNEEFLIRYQDKLDANCFYNAGVPMRFNIFPAQKPGPGVSREPQTENTPDNAPDPPSPQQEEQW